MTRSELVQIISDQNPHLYAREVEQVVLTILEEMGNSLEAGDRVELRGFGTFFVTERDARVGRNPKTGESVSVEAKVVPRFKLSKAMAARLND